MVPVGLNSYDLKCSVKEMLCLDPWVVKTSHSCNLIVPPSDAL